jgi:hypothetical protein
MEQAGLQKKEEAQRKAQIKPAILSIRIILTRMSDCQRLQSLEPLFWPSGN